MAALNQPNIESGNRLARGVLVIDGYATNIRVERRHLRITHGHGQNRHETRIPKVGHDISRLVVLGRAGTISLDAIRWLHRTNIALVHIDTDGTVLATTAPPGRDDARLRRQQALAADTDAGLQIAQDLLTAKLAGQAEVARTQLQDNEGADRINDLRKQLATCATVADVVDLEAAAAIDYFRRWREIVGINWVAKDQDSVPQHWTRFPGRRSLSNKTANSRATDPVNALLNYCYALAESECRLACYAVGLDPGIGIIHADTPNRDSLALDLIETIRPTVDGYVLDLIEGHVFTRRDFHETDNGHTRLLQPLTHHLAATLPTWRQAVAPWAEHTAHHLADASPHKVPKHTPLTSTTRRRTATTAATPRRRQPRNPTPTHRAAPEPPRRCIDCGDDVTHPQRKFCPDCWPAHQARAGVQGSGRAREQLTEESGRARRGQQISDGKRSAAERRAAELGYQPDYYETTLSKQVKRLTLAEIMAATGLSQATASRIRRGISTPRPELWESLAKRTKKLRQEPLS